MKIDKFIKSGVMGGMGLVMASKNAMAITAAHVATLGTHHLHQAEKVSEVAKVVNVENLSAFGQFIHNNPGLTLAGFGAMVGITMGGLLYATLKGLEDDKPQVNQIRNDVNENKEVTISDRIKGIRDKFFNNIEEAPKLKI